MSSKSSRKRERALAAARERQRRRDAAASASPLGRGALDDLWEQVATQIFEHGHDGSFAITERWLNSHGAAVDDCIEFLKSQRMDNDFDVLTNCDPRVLFGDDGGQYRRMPISRDQLDQLLNFLDAEVRRRGCDRTTAIAEQWLAENELPVTQTVMSCLALGGGCDCEIVLNVEADAIYTN